MRDRGVGVRGGEEAGEGDEEDQNDSGSGVTDLFLYAHLPVTLADRFASLAWTAFFARSLRPRASSLVCPPVSRPNRDATLVRSLGERSIWRRIAISSTSNPAPHFGQCVFMVRMIGGAPRFASNVFAGELPPHFIVNP